jgi:hypothetical protein
LALAFGFPCACAQGCAIPIISRSHRKSKLRFAAEAQAQEAAQQAFDGTRHVGLESGEPDFFEQRVVQVIGAQGHLLRVQSAVGRRARTRQQLVNQRAFPFRPRVVKALAPPKLAGKQADQSVFTPVGGIEELPEGGDAAVETARVMAGPCGRIFSGVLRPAEP